MPRDGAPTRTRLLDAAQGLVLDRGFAATTVDDVIAAAGSSKGAFFHHFASKDDLGRELVARYAAADIAVLEEFMTAAEAAVDDPAGQLLHFLAALEAAGDAIAGPHSSCLYVSFLGVRDLEGHNAEAIVSSITAWRERVAEKIARAAPALRDPADVADHLWATFEGAFILGRATGDTSHMRRQLSVVRRCVEALLRGG